MLSYANYRFVNSLIPGLKHGGPALLFTALQAIGTLLGESENIAFKEVIVLPISLIFFKGYTFKGLLSGGQAYKAFRILPVSSCIIFGCYVIQNTFFFLSFLDALYICS